MCRLALLNNEGIVYLQKNLGGINELFEHLESSFGGHGNGLAIFFKDGTKVIKKGVHLKNKNISKFVLKNLGNIDWIMYHTRLASIGKISDSNCHPYERGGKVLMMNGTETIYNFKNGYTDSENVLRSLQNSRMSSVTKNLKSVFIGYDNGLFITKGKGSLLLLKNKSAIIFASEFPDSYYDSEQIFEAPQTWTNNKNSIVMKNLVKKAKPMKYLRFDYSSEEWQNEVREYYKDMEKFRKELDMCREGETVDC